MAVTRGDRFILPQEGERFPVDLEWSDQEDHEGIAAVTMEDVEILKVVVNNRVAEVRNLVRETRGHYRKINHMSGKTDVRRGLESEIFVKLLSSYRKSERLRYYGNQIRVQSIEDDNRILSPLLVPIKPFLRVPIVPPVKLSREEKTFLTDVIEVPGESADRKLHFLEDRLAAIQAIAQRYQADHERLKRQSDSLTCVVPKFYFFHLEKVPGYVSRLLKSRESLLGKTEHDDVVRESIHLLQKVKNEILGSGVPMQAKLSMLCSSQESRLTQSSIIPFAPMPTALRQTQKRMSGHNRSSSCPIGAFAR
ncbi:MAG: hypothetical protein IPP74_02915 [Alphaproteobacteria bacterium]|nr:hypothetical protein [Alphaproteobacteria bacterium]